MGDIVVYTASREAIRVIVALFTLKFKLTFKFNYLINKDVFITKNFPKDTRLKRKFGFPFNIRYLGHSMVARNLTFSCKKKFCFCLKFMSTLFYPTEFDENLWKKQRAMFNPGFHRK
jgi:hypothetical protein